MSGILDKKSRILDFILTDEGRRQLAVYGTVNAAYATFSDSDVVYTPSYDPNAQKGHEDPTGRIYLEAFSQPQDVITFKATDAGHLIALREQDYVSYSGNIQGDLANGTLEDGKLVLEELQHSAKIITSDIQAVLSDVGCGFTYKDQTGNSAALLVDPTTFVDTYTLPSLVKIGTKNGINAYSFAERISKAITYLKNNAGPNVNSSFYQNYVYLDNGAYTSLSLRATGSLSSTLDLQDSVVGGRISSEVIDPVSFTSQVSSSLLKASLENFTDLRIISTYDRLDAEENLFETSQNTFDVDISQIEASTLKSTLVPHDLHAFPSIFGDEKLSGVPNYRYLPPIKKVSDTVVPDKSNIDNLSAYYLGDYARWGGDERLTYESLQTRLSNYADTLSDITITQTSKANNLLCQVFELSNGVAKKLDIIDYGVIEKSVSDGETIKTRRQRVFFVGKILTDINNTTCFVNIFTILFSDKNAG